MQYQDGDTAEFELHPIQDEEYDNARLLNEDARPKEHGTYSWGPIFSRWLPLPTLNDQTKWRTSVLGGSIASAIVLLVNLGFTIGVAGNHSVQNWIGVMYDGDCRKAENLSVFLHLLINILSTVLLSASNYCMQCLSAPTRDEVDRAHNQNFWLDIGIPSVRNLRRLDQKKALLWILLVVSSLPLHLLYNSAIFSAIQANAYDVFSVNESFLAPNGLDSFNTADTGAYNVSIELHQSALNSTLKNLSNIDCINAYAEVFQTTQSNLLLVTNTNATRLIEEEGIFNPYQHLLGCTESYHWICLDSENDYPDSFLCGAPAACPNLIPGIKADASTWSVMGDQVQYCLSEQPEQHCKLQFNLGFALIIIVFNAIKTAIMAYTAFSMSGTPLMTVGDAIASYMEREDEASSGKCLLSRSDVQTYKPEPHPFSSKRKRWKSAASGARWLLWLLFSTLGILTCASLLGYGISQIQGSKDLWSIGLGSISQQTLITGVHWPSSLIANTLIANVAQPIFSVLYFAYNGLFTCMAASHEWSQFAVSRKGLRVSTQPKGFQRSSYFLSLPYRFAIPLMVCSTVLHWLISQSIFLVVVEGYTSSHFRDPTSDVITCGYSPIAIICAIIVAVLMVAVLIVVGMGRFASAMPVASSCSMAIAAACHAVPAKGTREKAAEEQKLMWGVMDAAPENEDAVGHCGFSSLDVDSPHHGHLYK